MHRRSRLERAGLDRVDDPRPARRPGPACGQPALQDRRAGFQRACVERDARKAWINWRKAREFADAGPTASTSEMAVLDLAVAIGENRFKFSIMGPANSRMIAQAVARALGEDG